MTHITIFQNRAHKYYGFECQGHAGYAAKGEDVVCAGISALTIGTVNALEQFCGQTFRLETDERRGRILLLFEEAAGHDAELLIKSMVLGLEGILSDYGKEFLSLEYKEV